MNLKKTFIIRETHSAKKLRRTQMKDQIIKSLEKIKPMLQADGGDVELVEVEKNGIVKVRLQGACAGCPMSQMTLKNGIERLLMAEVKGVKAVESVD